jgi:hopanoid biosynthesis associated RND transporter like protein HpnN
MRGSKHTTSHRFAGIVLRHPFGIILVAALGVVLALLVTATHLTFQTNRLDLIASGSHYRQLGDAYDREFEDLPGDVIVVIRSDRPEAAKAFAMALAQRWATDRNIDRVLYRINTDALKNKALLYLAPDELIALRQKLQNHQTLLEELTASPTLQNLFALINREMSTALVGHAFTGFLEEDHQANGPPDLSLLVTLLQNMNQALDAPDVYRSPWANVFAKDEAPRAQDGYLWSDDKKMLFVLVQPKREEGQFNRFETAVRQIRADVSELRKTHPGVEVGITGKSVLDADEMAVAAQDTSRATLLSVAGVALLYFGLFKGVVRPFLALVTLVIGICWALGFTTLTIGHLNILSIVFMPMLLGLGIDYGSYFISRYTEERVAGKGLQEAMSQTFVATAPGIMATALTTALSFGTLLLTGFKGIAELGFIGGSGILLAALATFTVLPALLLLYERRRPIRSTTQCGLHEQNRGSYLEPLYRYPRAVLAASVLLGGLALLVLGKVGVDLNLLHLQARGTEAVAWMQKIFESTQRSVLYGEIVADSFEQVKRKEAALLALPSVAQVESIASVIPADQPRKVRLIRELQPFLAGISPQQDTSAAVDLEALRTILGRIQFKMAEDGEAAGDLENGTLREAMHDVRRLITRFHEATERMGETAALQALMRFQEEMGRDLAEKVSLLQGNLQAQPVTFQDLPPELRARYVGKTGRYRLLVYPAEDIWEFQPLARFVNDVRSVDPDTLGAPIGNFEYTREMKGAYQEAGLYALLGIVVLTLLTFRAVRPTLLALVPMAMGSFWMLGFMGFFRVMFNVANLIVVPLIMAPAVESGIMIVYRHREERDRWQRPPPLPQSTGRAVVFSTLSTIIGFGSLMISHHQGIFSIGLLLTLGVASVLLASITTLPSLLSILSSTGRKTADRPSELGELSRVGSATTGGLHRQAWPAQGDRVPLIRGPRSREPVDVGARSALDTDEW